MKLDRLILILALVSLSGCSSMQISDFENRTPKLTLEEYFEGRTWAWGIFEDRFGNLRREFAVDIDGRWDGETLTLDEHFRYSDGETERRVWNIEALGDGRYLGRADDIIGHADGVAVGNALRWQYRMKLKVGDGTWNVSFDDWMFLQRDGVMINRAEVSRWGLTIGTVTLFFSKQGPES